MIDFPVIKYEVFNRRIYSKILQDPRSMISLFSCNILENIISSIPRRYRRNSISNEFQLNQRHNILRDIMI